MSRTLRCCWGTLDGGAKFRGSLYVLRYPRLSASLGIDAGVESLPKMQQPLEMAILH